MAQWSGIAAAIAVFSAVGKEDIRPALTIPIKRYGPPPPRGSVLPSTLIGTVVPTARGNIGGGPFRVRGPPVPTTVMCRARLLQEAEHPHNGSGHYDRRQPADDPQRA